MVEECRRPKTEDKYTCICLAACSSCATIITESTLEEKWLVVLTNNFSCVVWLSIDYKNLMLYCLLHSCMMCRKMMLTSYYLSGKVQSHLCTVSSNAKMFQVYISLRSSNCQDCILL